MLSTTEEHLEQVFTQAAEPQPPTKKCVERVKKIKDYAFIHFTEREEASRALKAINGKSYAVQHVLTVKITDSGCCDQTSKPL